MHLALGEQRVDERAEVVDHRVFHHRDCAGIGIDLDLGDVTAIGKGRGRIVGDQTNVERLRQFRRQLHAAAQARRQLHDTDRTVGPDDGEAPAREFDIGGSRLHDEAGDLLAAGDDLRTRLDHGRAARHHRARPAGAAADEQGIAVALQQPDAVEGDAEPVDQDLSQGRGMALAVVERAGDHRQRAVRLEADAAHFLRRRRRHFEIAADAAAAQLAVRAALLLTLRKALPIGERQRLVEHGREFAAVIAHARRRLVGHRVRADVVAPPKLDTVDAHLGGGGVDEAFHVIIALRAARAAIGAGRGRVGEHALGRDLEQRRVIDAHHILHGIDGVGQRRDDEGAGIAATGEAQREETALGVEREFRRHLMIASVMIGDEALRTLVCPFDGTPQRACCVKNADIFGKNRGLHPEGAADMLGQHAHLLWRNVQDVLGQRIAQTEDTLAADMQRPAVGPGVVAAEGDARLHGIDDDAVADDVEADDMGGPREGRRHRRGVAIVIIDREIAGRLGMELRRASSGGGSRARHHGQRIDLAGDRFGGVLRGARRLRDDEGHRLTDKAHMRARQGRPRRRPHRRAVAVRDDDAGPDRTITG